MKIKDIIRKYCEDVDTPCGLFLLDMPTGTGKTHSVLDFIVDYVKNDGSKRIFFITTQKKNLQVDKLEERFEKAGLMKEYKERFLELESNSDSILESLDEEVEKVIRSCLPKVNSFENLLQTINIIRAMKDDTSKSGRVAKEKFEDDLRQKYEPAFRKDVKQALDRAFKTSDEKLNAIKKSDKWKWVGTLYPSVFTKEKKFYS